MLRPERIPSSEITPPNVYFNRRTFLRAGVALASLAATGAVYKRLNRAGSMAVETPASQDLSVAAPTPQDVARGFRVDEPMTTLESVGNYNNFYEFTTDKEAVAAAAAGFVARPWTVAVEGMVHKPKVFDLDEVLRLGPLEERVYRMRCVEGWSMVIPWAGLPLSRLLDRVEPCPLIEVRRIRAVIPMSGQHGRTPDCGYHPSRGYSTDRAGAGHRGCPGTADELIDGAAGL